MKTKLALIIFSVVCFALICCGCGNVIVNNSPTYTELTKMTDSELIDNYNYNNERLSYRINSELAQIYQAELNKREIIRAIENNK